MKNLLEVIKTIQSILSEKGKKLFYWTSAFSAIASSLDALSLSLMAPFVAVASDFSLIQKSSISANIYESLGFKSEAKFVAMIGVCILSIYILRMLMGLLNNYLIARFSYGRYYNLATSVFTNYLHRPLKEHSTRNTGDLTRAIMSEVNQLTHLFSALLTITSEVIVFIVLYIILLYVGWGITLIGSTIIGIVAFMLAKSVSRNMKLLGERRVDASGRQFRILNSAFGNFKLLKLQSMEADSLIGFHKACADYKECMTKYNVYLVISRYGLELIGFSLLIVGLISYLWIEEENIQSILPVMVLFGVVLFRLMPSVNRVLTSYNQILAAQKSLAVVKGELDANQEELGNESIEFKDSIMLRDASFLYDNDKEVLSCVNIEIKKGQRIAIVGESGQGKSTLADLIIGLIRASSGGIFVDGVELSRENVKSWRSKIGYVPQSVYLFDGSIRDNVVYGRKYDKENLNEVLRMANIVNYLDENEGINTLVGDGGVKISGGQRQRVAIARALYANPDILVLDEATSGLDATTEKLVLNEIYTMSKDITVISITHREDRLEAFDVIYRVKQGGVTKE